MFSHKLHKNEIQALAIGQFDGIHRAHKELFRQLGSRGGILVIDRGRSAVTPKKRRENYVSHTCFYYDFSKIKDLSGEEFVALLKEDFPKLQKIVVGYDFRFGKNRMFGVDELDEIYDGKLVIVPEFCYEGISVHMSTIRTFLSIGEMSQANMLLGREYSIFGISRKGQGLGKKLLFPTINLEIEGFLIPKHGVYASRTLIKKQIYNSVTFVGERFSTDGKFSTETHVIDTDIEVEDGEKVELFFVEFLRDNEKFDNLDILKKQIAEDITDAKGILMVCKTYSNVLNNSCANQYDR